MIGTNGEKIESGKSVQATQFYDDDDDDLPITVEGVDGEKKWIRTFP